MSLTSLPYFMKSFFSKVEKYSGDSVTMINPALDLLVQLEDDVARRAGGRDIAEPAARLVAGDILGRGGRIGPERDARRVGDGKQPQAPGLDVRRHAGDAVDAGLHLAADR